MKSLFFKSVNCNTNDDEKILAHQFIQISKKLSSGEILILKATYEIYLEALRIKDKEILQISAASKWATIVSNKLGYGLISLIALQEENLVKLKLISDRTYGDKSGLLPTNKFRLTDLGYEFCLFISGDK